MPPKIKARLGDVVDVTFKLKYQRSEVDRLPDREYWEAYLIALVLNNSAEDVLPAAADHNNDWPVVSARCPSGLSYPLPDNLEASYTPPAVTEDNQEVKVACWINPDFLRSKKGKPVFKPGLVCALMVGYCSRDLTRPSAMRKARFHEVAQIEIVSLEGSSAEGSESDTGWAVFKKGSPGAA